MLKTFNVNLFFSDLCFDPSTSFDRADIGTAATGKTITLKQTTELSKGPTNMQYLGVIFDGTDQLGFAASTIQATISATPEVLATTNLSLALQTTEVFVLTGPFKTAALRFANLSKLAYSPYNVVKEQLPSYKLVPRMQIYDAATDTNGFIASDEKTVVIAFTGTKSFRNLLTNVKFFKKPIMADVEDPDYAHLGFVKALDTVYSGIESEIKKDLGTKELVIIGHSLGGALASLTALRLSEKYNSSQPVTYLYGCPPVGDTGFAKTFKGMESNVITIENDFISSGICLNFGEWVDLYKPDGVMTLEGSGHAIDKYIEKIGQLE